MAARPTFDSDRHIDDVSNTELETLSADNIARLKGVRVSDTTLRSRMFRGMEPRRAAVTPPHKPQRPKVKQEEKRWNRM